jgi:putative FmdB family regulatory protein
MPSYCYTCENCGKTSEHVFEIQHRKQSVSCDCGSKAERDLAAEFGQVPHNKPFRVDSWALAVDPEDVPKTIAEDRAIGSTASEYLPDGRLRFTSQQQMRRYARDRGYIDRDSFI